MMELNPDKPKTLNGVRVLVVEDNPSTRSVVRRILERAGCMVIEAGAPSEAVSVARAYSGHLDIAIIDLVLPEMSGPECAEMLQVDRPGLAVAYMSGYVKISDDFPSDASAPVMLAKPFTSDELVSAIRSMLSINVPGDLG